MTLTGWHSAGSHRQTRLVSTHTETTAREGTARQHWEASCIKHRTDRCLLSTLGQVQLL